MKAQRKKRKKRKRNRSRHSLDLSQERASYFFFIGLLIIATFGCVASEESKQGFYGIIFISIGILVALFVLRKAPNKYVEAWADSHEDRGSTPLVSTLLNLN